VLGRTNRALYPLWVRGGLPKREVPDTSWGLSLLHAALDGGIEVFDLTVSHGFWGDVFRQIKPALMMSVVSQVCPLHLTPDSQAAGKLIQAHLIEILCATGRERCDFYFLAYKHPLQEYQIAGALEALEIARQEDQIGYLGLACYAKPLETLSFWRLHDAFDVVLLPDDEEDKALSTLLPEAAARRAGVILEYPDARDEEGVAESLSISGVHAALITARSAETIRDVTRRINRGTDLKRGRD
jgi:aryl-alcohol dehydrogenase-like predicted oxidoreductase